MFYCEKCRKKQGWSETFSTSHGPCECCGRTAVCYDGPGGVYNPTRRPAKKKRAKR
jgi:hypothetical protein